MNQAASKTALRLSIFTVVYNLLEGIASLWAGGGAGSIALVGFGLDSFLESLSGGVMIWRFGFHGSDDDEKTERVEQRAVRLVGVTFFLLGGYVLFESISKIIRREAPSPSLPGLIIALVSLTVMPTLFVLKRRTAKNLGSSSLLADSKQSLACMILSGALLLGLGLNFLFGFWLADPIVGILTAGYLFKEGWEALHQKHLCVC